MVKFSLSILVYIYCELNSNFLSKLRHVVKDRDMEHKGLEARWFEQMEAEFTNQE